MKQRLNNTKRYYVNLYKNNGYKSKAVHRLVAKAFIPNPNNLPQINHKDENPLNNCVNNLEWCTAKYNVNYGTKIQRTIEKQLKPVLQYDLNGNFIKKWNSLKEAREFYNLTNISECCKKHTIGKGFQWRYENDNKEVGKIKTRSELGFYWLKKQVDQYDLQGNFIKTWESITEAQKALKINNIHLSCKKIRKSIGGYIWKYKDVGGD